jgi:hypothetical protein
LFPAAAIGARTAVRGLPTAHVPPVGRIAELPSANVPVAVNCLVSVTKIVGVAGVTAIELSGLFTSCIRKGEVLERKFPSLAYIAVTVCSPGESVVMAVLVAIPPDKVAGEPKLEPSIMNCTVPVGVPPVEVIVAVKLTEPPTVDGFAEEITTVFVAASLITSWTVPVASL